jgi:hypothetical protein
MFALSEVHISLLWTRTEQVKPAPYVKPIQAKKNYPNGCIDVLTCGYETNRDVAAAQVVLQRGYTAVGQIAVNFGEGKLRE